MEAAGKFLRVKTQMFDSAFKKMLIASIGLHLTVLLSMTIRTYIFPDDEMNFETAIQVDIVDLPDKLQKLPPAVEEKVKEKPKPPAEPSKEAKETKKVEETKKVDLKAKKKTKDDALDKIKALQALENIKNEVNDDEEKQKQAVTKVKGNIKSTGTALSGIVTSQMAGYVQLIQRHAQDNWSIPKWLEDLNLKARAQVFLKKDGTVDRRFIVQTSGNETFDDMVLGAIDKASPFPPPPGPFVDLVGQKGIQLGFPE
jgi:colicin import membrane protein